MHELGVLCQIVKKVNNIAEENGIKRVKYITLEVGENSSFVPVFLERLFPVAIEKFPVIENAELKMVIVPGKNLVIKDIGYQ